MNSRPISPYAAALRRAGCHLLLQRRILLAQLRLDGRGGLRDIRQLDGANGGALLCRRRLLAAGRRTRSTTHEREQAGRQHARHAWIPLPSTMVM